MSAEPSNSLSGQAASFGGVADRYERARPGYPGDAVSWLVGPPPRRVLDLAAGTGKLTRSLIAAGHEVVAVDPSEDMLAQLRAALPDVEARLGTAESIPLDDRSVDVVVVAQAFHWFDAPPALRDIARVLRPAGRLGLVWNDRDETAAWVAALSQVIGSEDAVQDPEPPAEIAQSGLFEPAESAEFRLEQRLDRATLLDLVASRSYVAVRTPEERAGILAEVDRIFDAYAGHGDDAADPTLVLPYLTRCYRATRR